MSHLVVDYAQRLQAQQQELMRRIAALQSELSTCRAADFAEQATERENEEVAVELLHETTVELNQVNAALQRLKNENFGTCAKCGDPIGDERLEILPYTQFCRDCAK
ncbi:TraR/DksA family transcriptional regulator [Alteromonas flava]|uniref:TraR/DksA family transcriptional regulator n=1 Tax=Alteromonas flava TaxID=2048003 RepID=UPI000C282C02|nr:TraR/DksA C4-type zinc finger protein [Alteromonas flava]